MAGTFESAEGLSSHTPANAQICTKLQEIFESHTFGILERIKDFLDGQSQKREAVQIRNKEIKEDTVLTLQGLPDSSGLLDEEGAESQFSVILENKMDAFQIKREQQRDLEEPNQEDWREIFPEVLIQTTGKLPIVPGTDFINGKICSGILQTFYKEGLQIAGQEVVLMKGIASRREQDLKEQQTQMILQEFFKIKKGGGIRSRKRVRKKSRKKKFV